jgi:hypothetical protein
MHQLTQRAKQSQSSEMGVLNIILWRIFRVAHLHPKIQACGLFTSDKREAGPYKVLRNCLFVTSLVTRCPIMLKFCSLLLR